MKNISLNKKEKKTILRAAKEADRKHNKAPYQTIGSIKGVRDTLYRYDFMRLPKDFNGKSVLDIGCNLGAMCYEAKDRNAGRVVGIDKSDILLETSSNIFFKHDYDISFIHYNLNEKRDKPLLKILGEEKFDYIFALSIYHHINDKNVLWNIINNYCGGICLFEGHKRSNQKEMQKALTSNLRAKSICFIGNIKDHVKRPVFKCVFRKGIIW